MKRTRFRGHWKKKLSGGYDELSVLESRQASDSETFRGWLELRYGVYAAPFSGK